MLLKKNLLRIFHLIQEIGEVLAKCVSDSLCSDYWHIDRIS
jgi:hypothetical protein